MKIKYIHLIGFRGYRESTRIDIPPGFAVITGRNGAGKSTLCDAIEFALTGTMRAYSSHTEKGESIRDYIWWRGAGSNTDRLVEIGLILPDGKEIVVRRSHNGLSVSPSIDLKELMLNPGPSLDSPLFQLCRTSILRDEEITELSVDLPETERYDFVRSALGTADFSSALDKTKRITDQLKAELEAAELKYSISRDRITQVSTRISQERTVAAKTTLLAEAIAFLKDFFLAPPDDIQNLSLLAEETLATERIRVENLIKNYTRLDELIKEQQELASSEHKFLLKKHELALKKLEMETVKSKEYVKRLGNKLADAQKESPLLASLAQLYEHGRRIGLKDGQCPLCGTKVANVLFSAHLDKIRLTVETGKAKITELARESADATQNAEQLEVKANQLRIKVESLRRAEQIIVSEIEKVLSSLKALGFKDATDPLQSLLSLSDYIDHSRMQLSRIENALAAIRASQAAGRLGELEREITAYREQLGAAEKQISSINAALGKIQEGSQIIRRLQGELVDEQLAALSPLLLELFQRLRPHIDWPRLQYHLRGDIRRMLSLEVGAGHNPGNPSFIFSSGQRRAAGLAFLLAIHLSRNWCRLQTLILDDPVQHIDDYRALHLTEVLAAIRRTGKQIICTVEDNSLAELLARRLRSAEGDEGVVVRLVYEPKRGVSVAKTRIVLPLMNRILVSEQMAHTG